MMNAKLTDCREYFANRQIELQTKLINKVIAYWLNAPKYQRDLRTELTRITRR